MASKKALLTLHQILLFLVSFTPPPSPNLANKQCFFLMPSESYSGNVKSEVCHCMKMAQKMWQLGVSDCVTVCLMPTPGLLDG